MTACQTKGKALESYNTQEWKTDETLVTFLERVYPQVFVGGVPETAIDTANLSAHILHKNAGIEIKATNTLSDHLSLVHGEGFKTLLVFHHCAFLKHSFDVLKSDQKDLSHSTSEAISRGCLHPALLTETLRTLNLLFPPLDNQSRRILEKWRDGQNLDTDLLEPCQLSLSLSAEEHPSGDLLALYKQYPHWAKQLARLLKEVDDPTPITRWERYAERRKSPRHMYNCALAALIVAAIFGILATALAAVQVWISYCAWVDDPRQSLCGAKKTQTSPTLNGRI
ncbi:hypothetical protein BDP55DRAFT_540832 [Colletotrichum godetiae]|uniref:Uncharacterized protein n=1 Tax=Colletotrichum godetiae TaxID=1209918 RepID=A0AAJ0AYG2_9PEZI|nr:uncharacterized protein BDP55DRAFT_540832 [Colletotrichum godetiae]KAK1700106.1 hypothetical protein BDP55DRAFT_540832 [Colletotrichum godetiae]